MDSKERDSLPTVVSEEDLQAKRGLPNGTRGTCERTDNWSPWSSDGASCCRCRRPCPCRGLCTLKIQHFCKKNPPKCTIARNIWKPGAGQRVNDLPKQIPHLGAATLPDQLETATVHADVGLDVLFPRDLFTAQRASPGQTAATCAGRRLRGVLKRIDRALLEHN